MMPVQRGVQSGGAGFFPVGSGSPTRLNLVQALRPIQRRQAHALIRLAGLARPLGLPAPLTWKVFDAPFRGKLPPDLFLLQEQESGIFVGLVILWRPSIGECPMLHYGLDPRFRGKGYAAEGVRAVLALALGQEGAPGVAAIIANDNVASQRVARAAGMRPLGPQGDATLYGIFRPAASPRVEAASVPTRAPKIFSLQRPILYRFAAWAWMIPYLRRTLRMALTAFFA